MFAAIFIPNFSLQAVLRHEPELRSQPVALVDPEVPKTTLVQITPAARARGVCEGLTASQAVARCPGLTIKSRCDAQEKAATDTLLQTAYAFSPNIEATAPGVCTLDLKGLVVSFEDGSAKRWAENILTALASLNLEAKTGFAATPELALLAAREAEPVLALQTQSHRRTLVSAGSGETQLVKDIESFPISSLEPAPDILDILRRWGIHTVGAFLALGKDNVIERLGPAASTLFDRVDVHSIRPLKLVEPPQEFAEQMEFEKEIETVEPLLFVLRRFVEQIARRLELIYLVVGELHLRLDQSSGDVYQHTFKVPAPTGNVETLFRTLHTHLETVRTQSPITALRLSANPGKPQVQQFGLFETTLRDPNQFAETLARLTALLGPDRVGTPEKQPTHRPDVFRMKPVAFESDAGALRAGRRQYEEPRLGLALRRFRPAVSAHIEFRERCPALLRCSVFNGAIARARGPFLSSGQWWDSHSWTRDEWDVQTTDGALYRIVRSNDGCFVEGVYD